jgi:hypothetical protein
MEPVQMAVLWTVYSTQEPQQQRRNKPLQPPRPFAGRFGDQLRRIVFRAQLGPVGGHSPA